MAPASQPAFAKDEKTLCFHHELLYEAKVLDSKLSDPNDKRSGYQYKVHYKGWKNTWDDWVPQDRLRKLNDENKELAANLKKEMEESLRANTNKASASATSKRKNKLVDRGLAAAAGTNTHQGGDDGHGRHGGGGALGPSRGSKRGRELDMEREETFHTRPTIRILLPDRLKSILVDDWENVTKSLQLVRLPSRAPVSLILDDYSTHELSKRHAGSPDADILAEVIAGLREYFNKCLGRLLLYRFEREQYFEVYQAIEGNATVKGTGRGRSGGGGSRGDLGGSGIFKAPENNDGDDEEEDEEETNDDGGEALASLSGKRIEDVYGGEHLLRLFVSLPELIAQTNMDAPSVTRLREELTKMTLWLARDPQVAKYLAEPYVNASPGYVERARGS